MEEKRQKHAGGRPRKGFDRAKYKRPPKAHVDEDGYRYITVAQLVEYTGLHKQTIQARLRDGTLKGKKLGKYWCIDADQELLNPSEED